MDNPAPKRKTKTSTEVTNRYHAKTYKRYIITLRMDSDAEIIELFENSGKPPTETLRDIIKSKK